MADPITPAQLDELEALERAATAGPWKKHREEYDSHEAMTADTGLAYSRGGHVLHFLSAEKWVFPAFTGNGPTSKDNAALIAALRNAAPSLIASLRAAWARIEELERERDTLRARIEVADE